MISMAAIRPLPIWNALRRSYLNPLFLLRPIVSLPAPSQHTVVRSMVVGEKPTRGLWLHATDAPNPLLLRSIHSVA
jgi:hypothetical protein